MRRHTSADGSTRIRDGAGPGAAADVDRSLPVSELLRRENQFLIEHRRRHDEVEIRKRNPDSPSARIGPAAVRADPTARCVDKEVAKG